MYIPIDETEVTDEMLFSALDYNNNELSKVKIALDSNNTEKAKEELCEYFLHRQNRKFLFDYRSLPLCKINPDENPYFWQSSLGLNGSLQDFVKKSADKIMNNIYLLPGGKHGEINLGKNYENMLHFDFIKDRGKCHRYPLDMFVRGQFFEALAIKYHNEDNYEVVEKFKEILYKFFETYPLKIVDTSPTANRFMYTEDRDVMSVGWLTIVFISLLYTRLPYMSGYQATFDIIKRIWFFSMQFRRFDECPYKSYNHHLWERGLVPFITGVMLPEFPELACMKEHGAKIVRQHIYDDFTKDGGYSEHSTAYLAGATLGEMLTRGICISRFNNEKLLDDDTMGIVSNVFNSLAMISPPGTKYISIGDNGGPEINPILSLGVSSVNNTYCKEVLEQRTMGKATRTVPTDFCNTNIGYYMSRNNYSDKANMLLACIREDRSTSGHNHMDMLSLNCIWNGENIINEPDVDFLYHRVIMGSEERGYYYNMESHNSVLVHGKPILPNKYYANKWGVLKPNCYISEYKANKDYSYIDAFHDGYTFCRHRRKILFNKSKGFIVKDIIEKGTRQKNPHIQRWNLEHSVSVNELSDNMVLLTKNDVKLLFKWDNAIKIDIHSNYNLSKFYSEDIPYVIDVYFGNEEPTPENPSCEITLKAIDVSNYNDINNIDYKIFNELKISDIDILSFSNLVKYNIKGDSAYV